LILATFSTNPRVEYMGTQGEKEMEVDDVALMLRVRDGDEGAFGQLIERHRDRVVGMLYRMVGNIHDAEELAQDAFVRVYNARVTYRPEASFSTWLFRIVTNLALNHRRKKRPYALNDIEPKADTLPAADEAAQAETERRIWKAVQELPDRQRVALILTQMEGYSYEEAARAMAVTVESVRALVARSREALRGQLAPMLGGERTKE
jgi:RNA polymerase sigma-70 factor, ECF subfamily